MNDILVVDDDPSAIHLMGRILADVANLRFATCGEDAVRLMHESVPDLVLLDAQMPGMSGFGVFDALKTEAVLADVPVIFVTCHSESEFEVSALEMGAADFIAKPVSPPLLLARVRTQLRIKHLADELRRTATTDSLTGVANRRQFDELIEREWKRARRAGDGLSLMLVDVDHFKLYNDRYGHPMGDTCLQSVAKALAGSVRRTADFVARCGGEEFGVVLPQTGRRGAEYMAQHLLDSVVALGIPHAGSVTAPIVTVSIGVACYDAESACYSKSVADVRFRDDKHVRCTENELVLAADTALYSAKRAGRARARLLDIADVNLPHRVRDIEPNSVSQCAGAWA